MQHFRIFNSVTGKPLASFDAASPRGTLEAWAVDEGFGSWAEAMAQDPPMVDDGEIVIVDEGGDETFADQLPKEDAR